MGRVHLGKFYLLDGNADYSGTYLPGPTDPGVECFVFKASPLLAPKVYFGGTGISGLSFGKYYGPGFCSREFGCILGSVPIFGAHTLFFLEWSATIGSSKNNAFS